MKENLRLARLYFVLLAIVTVGRWGLGFGGVPYERGTQIFSIVILTGFSCVYYPAFARRLRGDTVMQGIVLGLILGVSSQLAIFASTLLSYAFGLETYFNHPTALNVPEPVGFGTALGIRVFGLFANTLTSAVVAALGWALGALLPGAARTPVAT